MDATRRDDLLRVRALVRERAQVLAQRTDARAAWSRLGVERADALATRLRAQRAVDQITRGPGGWLRRLLGAAADLPRLEAALAAAREQHEGLEAENAVLQTRLRTLDTALARTGNAEDEHGMLLAELERDAVASGSPHAPALVELAASEGRLRAARRALDDTLAAGDVAQVALDAALRRTTLTVADHGSAPFRMPAKLAAAVRPASELLAELRRQASGAAAIIPGIDLSRIRGTELVPFARFSMVLAPKLALEIARMSAEVKALMTALRGHERAMRDAEATLIAERERVVDLIRERL